MGATLIGRLETTDPSVAPPQIDTAIETLEPSTLNAMASLLLKFACDASALEALADGNALDAGAATLEPLVFRAQVCLAADAVLLSFSVQVPNLAPYDMVQLAGETGVFDQHSGIWHARAFERVLRAPGARIEKLALASRREVLRYASQGQVSFGVIVGDLVLLPARRGSGPAPISRAFLRPDFVVRRLRAENASLRTQLKDLEDAFNNVLTAVCPEGDSGEPLTVRAEAGPAQEPEGPPPGETPGAPRPPAPRARQAPAPNIRDLRGASDSIKAIIARENPTELRTLRLVLSDLLASANAHLTEAEQCIVCYERPASVLFIPCAHVCCCDICSASLPTALCPMCRAPIADRKAAPASAVL